MASMSGRTTARMVATEVFQKAKRSGTTSPQSICQRVQSIGPAEAEQPLESLVTGQPSNMFQHVSTILGVIMGHQDSVKLLAQHMTLGQQKHTPPRPRVPGGTFLEYVFGFQLCSVYLLHDLGFPRDVCAMCKRIRAPVLRDTPTNESIHGGGPSGWGFSRIRTAIDILSPGQPLLY